MCKAFSNVLACCLCIISCVDAGQGQVPASISVHLNEAGGIIDPKIYGHFTEETLSSFEGGISSEMLFNRKFEIPEERDIQQIIFTGVAAGWEPMVLDTSVTLVPDTEVYFSPSRSQRITLSRRGAGPAGIQQSGYHYVMPHLSRKQRIEDPFRFQPGETYVVRVACKSKDFAGPVHVALGESPERLVAKLSFTLARGQNWQVYAGELQPSARIEKGKFMVYIDSPGTVWIDSVSIARADLNEDGFRRDALELTRRVTPTSIRWPGGWFVSDYHWLDGVGPVDQRPARFTRPWNAYTTNDVGTDDFIALCRKLRADPYITVNVGTGTPEEAAQWVEYCNGGANTRMGRLRSQHGHPEPYNVKFWAIGNEEYLPTLGGTSGTQYGHNYNAFAAAMRTIDPTIKLVAVGAFDIPAGAIPRDHPLWNIVRYLPDWNKGVLSEAGSGIDYYSLHYYAPENVKGRSPEEVNSATLVMGEVLEGKLNKVQKQMEQFAPGGRRYPIALDEWSLKVDDDPNPQQKPAGVADPAQLGLHIGALTLREALAEATVFNLIHRRPNDFVLTSRTLLYAYLIGLITIRRDQAFATPAALMMELYSTEAACQSLRTEVASSTFSTKAMSPSFPEVKDAKHLDVSARVHPDKKTVDMFVINRNLAQLMDCSVRFLGGSIEPNVEITTLKAATLLARNTFDVPNNVQLARARLQCDGDSLKYTFPAHSITKLTAMRK